MIGELFEPLTKAQASRLRESILTEGVRDPVLVSPSGRVLSGANRKRIADELGLPYVEHVVKCADDTDELIVMIEHNPQRRVSGAARDEAVAMLSARGWSTRRIADMLGVDESTIRKAPGAGNPAVGTKVTSRNGARQPARRYSADERARRDELIADLWKLGYVRDAICGALDVGKGTVDTAVADAGLKGQPRTTRSDDPPPQPSWLDAPAHRAPKPVPEMPEPAPAKRRKTAGYTSPRSIAAEIKRVRDLFDVDRWALRACHDADEAETADDAEWMAKTHDEIGALIADLARLLRVLDDREYRDLQSRRDDGSAPNVSAAPKRLRAIK
jgi:ParB-like chromosome segregation protein Spo0J